MTGEKEQMAARYVVGFGASIVSLSLLLNGQGAGREALSCLFLAVICVTDSIWARIPNWATFTLLAAGLAYNGATEGLPGFAQAAAGGGLGLALLMIPFLMGGMGGGDVKALAALGAMIGPGPIIQVFLYMGLVGAFLSLLHWSLSGAAKAQLARWRSALFVAAGTRSVAPLHPNGSEKLRFPYAAAIALGFCAQQIWGAPL